MNNLLARSYQQGTQISELNAFAVALVGFPAHFLFPFIFHYGFGLAENFPLRMFAALLCGTYFFRHRLPDLIQRHLPVYWHLTIIVALPYVFTYNLLITDFHELWRYWAIFMVFILMIYVPSLIAFLGDLLLGILAAAVTFLITQPDTTLTPDFNVPLFAVVIVFTCVAGYFLSHNALRGALAAEKNKSLRALAGSIAHEMRNPLGQVKYNLDAIGRRLPTATGNDAQVGISASDLNQLFHLVAQGEMAVTRGVQVVNMILNEVNDRPIDPQQFTHLSAAHASRRALDEYGFDDPAERERVRLTVTEDFTFRGDETQFVFVIFNLLKNALYYLSTHPDAVIRITVSGAPDSGRIAFRDTGPGIPASEIPHLFDGFYTRGKKGGSGLGLAYCKRVMEAFGGSIECHSQLGEYTEFMMTFPVLPAETTESELARLLAQLGDRFQGQRGLLVDDDPLAREVARQHLSPLGLTLDDATNGAEAVEMASQTAYDIILMDINMPVMNGHDAARAILAAQPARIIGHTAEPIYVARTLAEKAGMLAVLEKPCSQIDLIRQVSTLLDQAPRSRQHEVADDDAPLCTLLLVEDSRSLRETLAMRYEMEGCQVIEAGSGNEALDRLRSMPCDVVLTDINMAGMDGYELTQQIRQNEDPVIARIPVIGLSGHDDATARALGQEAGMAAFLCKSTPIDAVLDAIRDAIRVRSDASIARTATVDLAAAAVRLGLSTDTMIGQSSRFLTDYQSYPRELGAALARGDRARLRELAHELKGVCRMFNADAAADAAADLERFAQDPDSAAEVLERATNNSRIALEHMLADLAQLDARQQA
ncbi:MAG: response regulator [Chromatiales bacterium]|nr:response regulator [Chromatiales bacterium]